MKKFKLLILTVGVISIMTALSQAQIKGQGVEFGLSGGISSGQSEGSGQDLNLNGRALIGIPLFNFLGLDLGAGLTRNSSDSYYTELIPVDLRLRLGWPNTRLTPYLYGGIGTVHRKVKTTPLHLANEYHAADDADGWATLIPVGGGLQLRLSPSFALDLSGGLNFTNTEFINPVFEDPKGDKDGYMEVLIGLRFAPFAQAPDADGDGLLNKEEKKLGTDPRKADTDDDGLDDYAEVNKYRTSPLKADTDGDGLNDNDELNIQRTNPLAADSDGDKLNDGEEVNKYRTNPNKADTDGDGLNDYSEVQTYKTDPLKADTDGDGLNDGDEVTKHKTDPVKADTDAGTVNDGIEVGRGTDPLNAADDVPKKAVLKLEKGKAVILEGIVFKTASAEILPASEEILMKAYNTLEENKDVKVEIQGHTDNVGKREYNMKLSLKRAESVKLWLVNKGIDTGRLDTKGLGPDKPVADNSTPEGRQQNRRIEFVRTN